MSIETFTKQPADRLDYDFDFTEWFEGRSDSIATYTQIVEPGLDLVTVIPLGNVIKLVLGGGLHGETYKVTVRITTVGGLIKEHDIRIKVKEI